MKATQKVEKVGPAAAAADTHEMDGNFANAQRLSANSAQRGSGQQWGQAQDVMKLRQMPLDLPDGIAIESASKIEDYDDEAQHSDGSQSENMHIQRAFVENLIHDDSPYAGAVSYQRQGDKGVHSGDELDQRNKDLARGKPYEKALSQCAQPASPKPPFPLEEKPRRVSEQGAALAYSQPSYRQFQSDPREQNSANYFGISNCSEANSGMSIRAGSGLAQSDGAALHRQQQPTLAQSGVTHHGAASSQLDGSQAGSGNQMDSSGQKTLSESAAHINSINTPHQNLTSYEQQQQQLTANLFVKAYNPNQRFLQATRQNMREDQFYQASQPQYSRQSGSDGELYVNTPQGFVRATGQTVRDFDAAAMDGRSVFHHQKMQQQHQMQNFMYQQSAMHAGYPRYVMNPADMGQHPDQMGAKTQNFPLSMQHVVIEGPQSFQSLSAQGPSSSENNSSIFSGTPDHARMIGQNRYETPRQYNQHAYDNQIFSRSGQQQSMMSSPGMLIHGMRNQTPTLMATANYTPEIDQKQRNSNKTSAGKSKLQSSQLDSSNLIMQQQDKNSGALLYASSTIDSSHPLLQTLSASATPSPAKQQHPGAHILSTPPNATMFQQQQHQMQPGMSMTFSQQQLISQQQQEMLQKHLLIQQAQQQQNVSPFPQFEHGNADAYYWKVSARDPQSQLMQAQFSANPGHHHHHLGSEHTSSTTSLQMQQLQPMFEDLQINSNNFRGTGGGSEAKPALHATRLQHHAHYANSNAMMMMTPAGKSGGNEALHKQTNVQQFKAQQKVVSNSRHHPANAENPNHANGSAMVKSGSKSEAANSQKSGYSGMISKSSTGGSGSQRTQTTAHSTNTESNVSDDQQSSILISRLQKLPSSASWGEKQAILSGRITQLATTQTGSRYLQNQLTKSNPILIEFLLHEVGQQLSTIMINQYGNYFFQKLLSNCSVEQRMRILQLIEADFISICCHKQGTHTIQTIFDNVTMDHEESFIRQVLQGHVDALSVDPYGTHVIRKVLQCRSFNQEKQSFIFDEIYANLNQLCFNKNGLCVIKIIIEKTWTERQRKRVIDQISHDLIELVSDPFGNYAVSLVMEKWDPLICRPIFEKLSTKIFELSIQKYSSCVIEKCMEYGDAYTRSIFIAQIAHSERLYALISHNYGNFVIQKALKLAHGQEKEDLIMAIESSFPKIQDKKIHDKWQKISRDSVAGTFVEQRIHAEDEVYISRQQQYQQEQFGTEHSQYFDKYDASPQLQDYDAEGYSYESQQPSRPPSGQQPKYRTKQQRSPDQQSNNGSGKKERQSRGSGGKQCSAAATQATSYYPEGQGATKAVYVPSSGNKPSNSGRSGRTQKRGQGGRGSGGKQKAV